MKIQWSEAAWHDYVIWQAEDKKTTKRINNIIRDMARNPFQGIGKPEALKGQHAGLYSRRIDQKNRIVYRVEKNIIEIFQCRSHYND